MGGIGSGGWQHGKDTTSGYRSLDVRRLQRDNLLSPGLVYTVHWTREKEDVAVIEICTQAGRLILNYQHRSPQEDWRILKYPVLLDWTDCTFGGRRAWFRCPANGCGRRVALLYLGRAGIFACRHCYRLVYNCQREKDYDRAVRRADKIRTRLGWNPGILNESGCKPKSMQWRTFNKLKETHDDFVQVAIAGMIEQAGLINRQLNSAKNSLKFDW